MHSVKLTQEYLKKRGVQVLEHAPYSPNLAPIDFSLFPKFYKEPTGVTMTPEEFRYESGADSLGVFLKRSPPGSP
jgi:hypothetical protein